ncbi:histidine triad nucleotide-binding protein [bacterium]|nr:histidine triad nucleotide-binding protein [bacterium]
MKQDCLFCKIVLKEVSSEIIYENKYVMAFNDINPQAPTHILIIPKIHISTLNDIKKSHNQLIGELVEVSSILAKKIGVHHDGYRTVLNCNKDAGQTVFHIHLHLLAGRKLNWPPG